MTVLGFKLHVSTQNCRDPKLIRKKIYSSFLISIAVDTCVQLFALTIFIKIM